MKNPYDILGVNKDASDKEIKKAYRKLAIKYHPDKSEGNEERFKEVASAYDILSNPKKKAAYDNQRSNPFGNFDHDFFEDLIKQSGFSDQFNSRYGWSNSRGANTQGKMTITLEEAYHGASREIRVGMRTVSVNIPAGVKPGQRLKLKGLGQRGMTEDQHGDLLLTIDILDTNELFLDEKGLHTIKRINLYDALLGGKGTVEVFGKTIRYTIPSCVQHGKVLRIRGKGFPVYNNTNMFGDLYVNIFVVMPEKLTKEQISLVDEMKKISNTDESKG